MLNKPRILSRVREIVCPKMKTLFKKSSDKYRSLSTINVWSPFKTVLVQNTLFTTQAIYKYLLCIVRMSSAYTCIICLASQFLNTATHAVKKLSTLFIISLAFKYELDRHTSISEVSYCNHSGKMNKEQMFREIYQTWHFLWLQQNPILLCFYLWLI